MNLAAGDFAEVEPEPSIEEKTQHQRDQPFHFKPVPTLDHEEIEAILPSLNVIRDWIDSVYAYASTYQAQEEEGEVTAEQKSVVFTVRWCSETRGLTSTGFRIRFREQLYNIESVDPMNYQKKILKIHCRLERRQPDEQNRQHR